MKFRTFYSLAYTIKRVKKQPTEQEKNFANHVSVKELISGIYRKLKLNNKRNLTIQFKKIGKEFEQILFQEKRYINVQ